MLIGFNIVFIGFNIVLIVFNIVLIVFNIVLIVFNIVLIGFNIVLIVFNIVLIGFNIVLIVFNIVLIVFNIVLRFFKLDRTAIEYTGAMFGDKKRSSLGIVRRYINNVTQCDRTNRSLQLNFRRYLLTHRFAFTLFWDSRLS